MRGSSTLRSKLKRLVADELELDMSSAAAQSLKCSRESRFSSLATCHEGDVIIFKHGGGGFKAGKVQLHFEIHGLAISIIVAYDLHKLESDCGYSVWTPASNIFIETCCILDTVVSSVQPDGKVGVLLPLEFR